MMPLLLTGLEETTQQWIKPHVYTPGAADPPLNKTRKRPLIYVHELPSAYNSRMLQASKAAMALPRLLSIWRPNQQHKRSTWLVIPRTRYLRISREHVRC